MRRLLIAVAALLLACGYNSAPTDPLAQVRNGKLVGLVTIGPNCPGPSTPTGCPTPPSAYAARKVQVWDAGHAKLLYTVDIDNGGFYSINLMPNTYTVDLKKNGIDRSADVPVQIEVKANETTRVDIAIDTGIR